MKFNIINMQSQQAILNIFQIVNWTINPKMVGTLESLIPCIEEHSLEISCDNERNINFYVLYYLQHKPNKYLQMTSLTPKSAIDYQLINHALRVLMADSSLNIYSCKFNFDLYLTRTNSDCFAAKIYPGLNVFQVEINGERNGYEEWESVLSKITNPRS